MFTRVLNAMKEKAGSTRELQQDIAHKMDYWTLQGSLSPEMLQQIIKVVFTDPRDLKKAFATDELAKYLLLAANEDPDAPYIQVLIPAIFEDVKERHAFQVQIGAKIHPVAPRPTGLPLAIDATPPVGVDGSMPPGVSAIPPRRATPRFDQTQPYAIVDINPPVAPSPQPIGAANPEAADMGPKAEDFKPRNVIELTRGRLLAGAAALVFIIGGTVMATRYAIQGTNRPQIAAADPQAPEKTSESTTRKSFTSPVQNPAPKAQPASVAESPRPTPPIEIPVKKPESPAPQAETQDPKVTAVPQEPAEKVEANTVKLNIATRKYFGKMIIDHNKSFSTYWKAQGWEKASLTQDGGIFGIKLVGPNGKTAIISNREVEAGAQTIEANIVQK